MDNKRHLLSVQFNDVYYYKIFSNHFQTLHREPLSNKYTQSQGFVKFEISIISLVSYLVFCLTKGSRIQVVQPLILTGIFAYDDGG